ncbi:MAG TPA: acylphosphatase [Steroidobacteraceae bacterium]|nr:acylphosphatase [Steroidobacteraceae bacterium]
MSEVITRRFVVTGRVQGVYYRASTREKALQLRLLGYAKNLSDGSVEVVASGNAADVESLEQWLWQGPPTATVSAVQRLEIADSQIESWSGFATL